MKASGGRKLVLVTRRTRLDELTSRFNTESQARFYIEQSGQDYSDYRIEHVNYYHALRSCEQTLSSLGRMQRIDRAFLPNFIFGPQDIVWALGQDGLVANALKYLHGQPLVGINPDPLRWDGVLLPFSPEELKSVAPEILQSKRSLREVTMASTTLNNGEKLLAVNDFFIGPKSHTSARYILDYKDQQEEQSSSGVIVSTGLGSTGWFKSLLAGASGVASKLTNREIHLAATDNFHAASEYLYFTVREPFPSASSKAGIIFGKITPGQPLHLTSRMPDHGVIFSDGIEADFLQFNSGARATISVANERGMLVT